MALRSGLADLRQAMCEAYLQPEEKLIDDIIDSVNPDTAELRRINKLATTLVNRIRSHPTFNKGFDAFMTEYKLDTSEGVRLMTLAEALSRIPDEETKESLIRSKLTGADWSDHLGRSLSPLVNSSTRALLFTTSLLEIDHAVPWLNRLIHRLGDPAIRIALDVAMNLFSQHFVLGETLDQAHGRIDRRFSYSFDMLGEAALTAEDAKRFETAYLDAIDFAGRAGCPAEVSIKLSALHPRFESTQQRCINEELLPRIKSLIAAAEKTGVGITIDAEEADRHEITLQIFEDLVRSFPGFDKLGLAVQAYSRRALPTLAFLRGLSADLSHVLPVRLVKGAYWDTEIKHAQLLGLSDYPVFTRKEYTDVCYLACAKYLLANLDFFRPQFATHNVQTVATILTWSAGPSASLQFQFQRLHGMGSLLYETLIGDYGQLNCCVYAPIGQQRELLPYLIRRLIENSANTSFINMMSEKTSTRELIEHPARKVLRTRHTCTLAPPSEIYQPDRPNSRGINFHSEVQASALLKQLEQFWQQKWHACPIIDGHRLDHGLARKVRQPYDHSKVIGTVVDTEPELIGKAVEAARKSMLQWQRYGLEERKQLVERFADLLEANRAELIALTVMEAGKTIADSMTELREAVDFCRYYSAQALKTCLRDTLSGPTGELNLLTARPRGTVLCISPWNFPMAIYVGQMVAALLTGNMVIAKPAEQTTLVAYRLLALFWEAGLPRSVIQFLPGVGESIGPLLCRDEGIDAVVFTGSFAVAKEINQQLALRPGPIVPFIAETGGQNVMIADSSALLEQLVKDVILSSFNSAGQRCSALRVLYIQKDSAEKLMDLLGGAIAELKVGCPELLETDVGPLIDGDALSAVKNHLVYLDNHGTLLAAAPKSAYTHEKDGTFLYPVAYQIDSITELQEECFGPVLHVVSYQRHELDQILEDIRRTNYGLTFGIHSRNEHTVEYICQRVEAGNIYVNRNMIGAVVGTQPFGGYRLSGTGPKAGGPSYLAWFVCEVSESINTAAVGGDISLTSSRSRGAVKNT